jgi:hypothetical protein
MVPTLMPPIQLVIPTLEIQSTGAAADANDEPGFNDI